VKNLLSLFKAFFVIGLTSFGGYMALVAMVRDRFAVRSNHIDDQVLSEGIALSSILPGPIAVNVVGYVGYYMAGFRGALTSVIAVILPSFLLVLMLSILYFNYDHLINFNGMVAGILPVVVAVILSVGISMGRKAITTFADFVVALFSLLIVFYFDSYIAVIAIILTSLFAGFLLHGRNRIESDPKKAKGNWLVILLLAALIFLAVLVVETFVPDSMTGLLFVKFSSVSLTLFGGGYVMVPILQNMLVDQLGWVTQQEFVYGISIGQVTPGPILISAAFFGFKMAGISGALLATVGIFFPSAFLMIVVSKIYIQYNIKTVLQPAFKTVRPAIVGLVVYSALSIFITSVSVQSILLPSIIVLVSLVALLRFNVVPALLVVLGGIIGILIY
jgi:chromate transporter